MFRYILRQLFPYVVHCEEESTFWAVSVHVHFQTFAFVRVLPILALLLALVLACRRACLKRGSRGRHSHTSSVVASASSPPGQSLLVEDVLQLSLSCVCLHLVRLFLVCLCCFFWSLAFRGRWAENSLELGHRTGNRIRQRSRFGKVHSDRIQQRSGHRTVLRDSDLFCFFAEVFLFGPVFFPAHHLTFFFSFCSFPFLDDGHFASSFVVLVHPSSLGRHCLVQAISKQLGSGAEVVQSVAVQEGQGLRDRIDIGVVASSFSLLSHRSLPAALGGPRS
mmetsp:Transcript_2270/g.4190  ORF Transcript_2270/g.4190 Transcript_2270/m.4190 type:complete len:278 (-) Transcript_2270:141-974(-)